MCFVPSVIHWLWLIVKIFRTKTTCTESTAHFASLKSINLSKKISCENDGSCPDTTTVSDTELPEADQHSKDNLSSRSAASPLLDSWIILFSI